MCGISGAIGEITDGVMDRLGRATDLMFHRGPDDRGLWNSPNAALGFRRLAIIDLSASGHQPMTDPEQKIAVVFNGEIYNYLELRKELEPHFAFRSKTDTEVLLHGFKAWGWEGLLSRIDGMFAFAIWDEINRVLYAARDRVGKKPFFYVQRGNHFYFASTLDAIVACLGSQPEVDPAAVHDFLTHQTLSAPLTIYKNVRQLKPAHFLRYDATAQTWSEQSYWDVSYSPKWQMDEQELLDELDTRLRAAVGRRLISDVPLGAFLSGGVDSSLVVAYMASITSRPVEAMVMGFQEESFNEIPFARLAAKHLGVTLHEQIVSSSGVDHLPEILSQYGQPHADVSIVPTYFVAKAAKSYATVVLNGDGGDELFAGYSRPVLARAAQTYRTLLPAKLRSLAGSWMAGRNGWLRKAALLAEAGSSESVIAFRYNRGLRRARSEAYAPNFQKLIEAAIDNEAGDLLWAHEQDVDDVDRVLYLDYKTYLPDQLLSKMDVSTMAHSIEARSPLLDRSLTEFAARIPTNLRLKGYKTKYLLKEVASRYLPAEILHRPKRGFVMPVAGWLRGNLQPVARNLFSSKSFAERGWIQPQFAVGLLDEHVAGKHDHSDILWTILILELWMKIQVDRTIRREEPLFHSIKACA